MIRPVSGIFWGVLLVFIVSCGESEPHVPDPVIPKKDSTGAVPEPVVEFDELAESYESPERENWQKPAVLIAQLGDLSDKTVADIGAGTGYFTFRLSEKAGKVIAVDIDERFLNYINEKQQKQQSQGIANIETRLTGPSDPALKDGEADLVFTVNTYHLIERRVEYLKKVKQGISPGGKLVIVDYRKENLPVGPPLSEKADPDLVVKELTQAGFDAISIDLNTLPYQYIITAETHLPEEKAK